MEANNHYSNPDKGSRVICVNGILRTMLAALLAWLHTASEVTAEQWKRFGVFFDMIVPDLVSTASLFISSTYCLEPFVSNKNNYIFISYFLFGDHAVLALQYYAQPVVYQLKKSGPRCGFDAEVDERVEVGVRGDREARRPPQRVDGRQAFCERLSERFAADILPVARPGVQIVGRCEVPVQHVPSAPGAVNIS